VVSNSGLDGQTVRAYSSLVDKTVGIREAKARLSELIRSAEAGDEITITDNGRPAVRLVRVEERSLPERLAALERRGLLVPQQGAGGLARPIRSKTPGAAQRLLREDPDGD